MELKCEGTISPQVNLDNYIVIPEVPNPLSDQAFEELREQVNPLANDEDFGIGLYIQACAFVAGTVQE